MRIITSVLIKITGMSQLPVIKKENKCYFILFVTDYTSPRDANSFMLWIQAIFAMSLKKITQVILQQFY